MHVLAIEPYYGGSHKAFLDGWQAHSRHQWDLRTLPAYKWKWRMRHAPVTLAAQLMARSAASSGNNESDNDEAVQNGGQAWELLFCSDMLNLAEFRGLAAKAVRDLPCCVLFHENQLTYPSQHQDSRDLHFAFSNITTALAADQVWFNSCFHQKEFIAAARELIRRMPDHQPTFAIDAIAEKSSVQPLGITPIDADRPAKQDRVLDILWAARWEHDKDPETFFDAIRRLRQLGAPFRLHVIGESFRDVPDIFEKARHEFAAQIGYWGYLESRDAYATALAQSDVIVSTAKHEFFGLSVLEAMSAGVVPLLPERLSYPELLAAELHPMLSRSLYDGTVSALADELATMHRSLGTSHWRARQAAARRAACRFAWPAVAARLDDSLVECLDGCAG